MIRCAMRMDVCASAKHHDDSAYCNKQGDDGKKPTSEFERIGDKKLKRKYPFENVCAEEARCKDYRRWYDNMGGIHKMFFSIHLL